MIQQSSLFGQTVKSLALSLFLLGPAFLAPCVASTQATRVFDFNYKMRADNLPSTQAVDVYIPIPTDQVSQRILQSRIEASLPVEEGWETRYNNRFYHLHRPKNNSAPIDLDFSWTVSRSAVIAATAPNLSEDSRATFLDANLLVPVNHPLLNPILEEIHALRLDDSDAATARAIFDWIVDNVEYKKVGTGWGNGDTFWACNERYGNCTDFHALFISLARSEGIPARFEMGFPIPRDKPEGLISGYHCWVQIKLPQQGWIPIDASEAAKDPENRDNYFAVYPADRVQFTAGRDLVFTDATRRSPLNYFVYPYVEVGGEPWSEKLHTEFSYRELH